MAITNKILIAFVFTILCVTSDVHCNTYASPPTHCAPSASPSDDGQEIKCFTYNQCAFWKSGERLCDGSHFFSPCLASFFFFLPAPTSFFF
ncbi:hypothetical protein YC2023_117747 [Brassica napus]